MRKLVYTTAAILLTLPVHAMNTFTLYAFKSSVGINWKSPKALASSVVKNEGLRYLNGNKRLLGHVSIKIKCGERELITAMTSRDGETKRTVLKEHSGLGVLFHIFPGELEGPDKLNPEIASKRKSGRVHSATYLISDSACEAMFEHYENFVRNGGPNNYGFPLDTLGGEGAGCSAFGVSFLQTAKIANPDHLKQWSGSVWVPKEFIGPYNSKKYFQAGQAPYENLDGGEDVKLIPLLASTKRTKWATAQTPGARYLEFFDPDTMFKWMEKMDEQWSSTADYQKRRFGKSVDLVFDYRDL